MKKKLAALLFALVIALAGCAKAALPEESATVPESSAPDLSASNSSASDSSAQAAPAAPQEPQAKTEVTIGFPGIPSNFDPLATSGHGSFVPLLYSTLVALDSDVNVVPDLAESYEISVDALTYTFKLRSDAVFTDGVPVKATDAAFTLNTIMSSASEIDLSAVESASASGDTVTVKLKQPRSTFILDVAGIGIAPEHAYGSDFALSPLGSGPFKLEQYDVDQQMILVANELYYGKAPQIKRAIFVNMSDEDTQLIAAKSGEVDITLTSAPIAAATQIEGYNLLVEKTVDNMGIVMPVIPAGSGTSALGNPMGNDITSDVNLRKAIAYAIDRQQLCDEALNGYGTPAYSENDGMPWWNPESAIETDLEYAKKLLDDAGWVDTDGDGIREKNGLKASIPVYYFAGDSARQATAMSAANQVLDIGVELKVEGLGDSDVMKIMVSQPLILAWGSSNPITSYYLYHSSSIGKDDWYDPESFGNPTVDKYLDQALNAKSVEEAIPFWQKAQWDGQTGTSMRGECPYIFLVNKDHLYFRRDGLNTGKQMIHAHGASWTLVANLRDWHWE
ncbi:MAG: ABC transporter substrate-binding protein [Clostridiales bacterium]|jgi:peptide/nickel transport system substrate-binding protein|nr:ABC transporter substrate-binding protein [Clostridiales bacterium]